MLDRNEAGPRSPGAAMPHVGWDGGGRRGGGRTLNKTVDTVRNNYMPHPKNVT